MQNFSEGNAREILDPNLSESPSTDFALGKVLELALQCMAPSGEDRPSMRRCAEVLWRIRKYHTELFSAEPLAVPSQWRNASSNGRLENIPHSSSSSKSKYEEGRNQKAKRSSSNLHYYSSSSSSSKTKKDGERRSSVRKVRVDQVS